MEKDLIECCTNLVNKTDVINKRVIRLCIVLALSIVLVVACFCTYLTLCSKVQNTTQTVTKDEIRQEVKGEK
jgi:multisubunit Na+/H+ antiporter MnhC subunit